MSEIRKDYSRTLTEKGIEGHGGSNFLDVKFGLTFRKQEFTDSYDSIEYEISHSNRREVAGLWEGSFPAVASSRISTGDKRFLQTESVKTCFDKRD